MNESSIRFNLLKHHLGFITSFIKLKPKDWQIQLLELGNLHFDVYTGQLSVKEIKSQILLCLLNIGVQSPQQYFDFLGDELNYKTIAISDGSYWVLRWGIDSKEFIHIHIARFGPHTLRVKSTALKTAIALAINHPEINTTDINSINDIRAILGISPINSHGIESINELLKLISGKFKQ
ncbi:hypothetical protein [Solitalea lacus]|uniref:hypothetical protein n=1 Tax=Solitalea lacus TaxID=2911172 RepID=UPI001EDC211D|nr:hypothetical protein [Solitalea lacus]UKJ08095.1 hypothetical protein L2B55_02755 [Solitalea lacus]